MMAVWFAAMQAAIEGLNKTQEAILAEMQKHTKQLEKIAQKP